MLYCCRLDRVLIAGRILPGGVVGESHANEISPGEHDCRSGPAEGISQNNRMHKQRRYYK